MSTVHVNTALGFDNRRFWISNSSESTDERFSGLVSSSGNPLLGQQERTYSTFAFEANGLTYRYIGSFTFTADSGLLGGSVSAEGTYDRVEVRAGDTLVAAYDGPSRAVDFGTYNNVGLVGNLLGFVTDLLFGPDAVRQSYANLHTDATPNLSTLAYADGVTATGGQGDDTLFGASGADVFDGGAGADRFHGVGGNDTYIIRDAADRAYEAAGNGYDQVHTDVSYSLGSQAIERLVLMGTDDINANGNFLNNSLLGNSGDNSFDGRGGSDTMHGRAGDDRFIVDSVGDRVVEHHGNGRDIVTSRIQNYTLEDNVEDVLISPGTQDYNVTGNNLSNSIRGNAGDNVISGKVGADLLNGLGGRDNFVFDTQPGPGNVDRIVDFAGDDTIVLENAVFGGIAPGELAETRFKVYGDGQKIDSSDRVLYNENSGTLWYDADGSGSTKAVHIATLQSLPGLTADDILIT